MYVHSYKHIRLVVSRVTCHLLWICSMDCQPNPVRLNRFPHTSLRSIHFQWIWIDSQASKLAILNAVLQRPDQAIDWTAVCKQQKELSDNAAWAAKTKEVWLSWLINQVLKHFNSRLWTLGDRLRAPQISSSLDATFFCPFFITVALG